MTSARATCTSTGRTAFERGQLGPGLVERVPGLLVLQGLVVQVLARAGRLLEEQLRPAPVPLGGPELGLVPFDERLLGPDIIGLRAGLRLGELGPGDLDLRRACRTAASRRIYGSRIATTCPACTRSPTATRSRSNPPPVRPAAGRQRDHLALGGQPPQGAHPDRQRTWFGGWLRGRIQVRTSDRHPRPGHPDEDRHEPEFPQSSPPRGRMSGPVDSRPSRIDNRGGRHDRITPC